MRAGRQWASGARTPAPITPSQEAIERARALLAMNEAAAARFSSVHYRYRRVLAHPGRGPDSLETGEVIQDGVQQWATREFVPEAGAGMTRFVTVNGERWVGRHRDL